MSYTMMEEAPSTCEAAVVTNAAIVRVKMMKSPVRPSNKRDTNTGIKPETNAAIEVITGSWIVECLRAYYPGRPYPLSLCIVY